MDHGDPEIARQIVSEYAKLLEQHASAQVYPAALADLPYPKEIIKASIRTSVAAVIAADAMTSELRDFFEVAYISLADYVEDDLVRLMREYKDAGTQLAADSRFAREKRGTPAWERLSESSRLVGELARTMADETERLRREFREFANTTSTPR